jgi:GNAT superfamily N-acetyltransferase
LSLEQVSSIYENSKHRDKIVPIEAGLAARLTEIPDPYFEITDFNSVQDFIRRGIGFVALDGDTVMGVAYSSLVCSTGIEVSIFVDEPYRQQGIATALGSRLVLECLRQNLRPNWDAANPESCKLAKKLGFIQVQGQADDKLFGDIFPRIEPLFRRYGYTEMHMARICGVRKIGDAEAVKDALILMEDMAERLIRGNLAGPFREFLSPLVSYKITIFPE